VQQGIPLGTEGEARPAAQEPQPQVTSNKPPESSDSAPDDIEEGSEVARFYLVLFQNGERPNDLYGFMNQPTFRRVQEELDDKITTIPHLTEIDIWLESYGGLASIAYKLFLDLRSRCRKLRVVIIDYAKSAATLLALGCDEIYMAPAAELGPLDAQIPHPDREHVIVSALDISRALNLLREFAVDSALTAVDEVLSSISLPRQTVLKEVFRFTALFLKPAVGKLDPSLTFRAANDLDVAHRYAEIMLTTRKLAPEDERDNFEAKKCAHHLIAHYPSHDSVISRDESRTLGLPVRDLESYDRFHEARAFHRTFRGETLIEVFDQSDLESMFESDEDEDDASVVGEDEKQGQVNHEDTEGKSHDVPGKDQDKGDASSC
jgi:hypothetical protein